MKPSSFQTTIENQFDYICKRAMEDERKNYMLYLSRIAKREVSFSDVGDYLVSQFATTDNYSTDFQIFTLNGLSVGVENDLLSEALRELPDKKREILLLFYLWEFRYFLELPAIVSYWVVTVMCFVAMGVSTMFVVQIYTLVQTQTPPQLVGKIMATLVAVAMCGQPIGQMVYGILFDVFIQETWVVMFVASIASIMISIYSKRIFQKLEI